MSVWGLTFLSLFSPNVVRVFPNSRASRLDAPPSLPASRQVGKADTDSRTGVKADPVIVSISPESPTLWAGSFTPNLICERLDLPDTAKEDLDFLL
jgi:hypothetical protein